MMPRVLLVEDDVDVAYLSAAALEDAGFEVEVAGTVDAALKACVTAVPDVAVVDVQLPYSDGWEFVRAVREGYAPVMHIAIHSVHADNEDTAEAATRWKVDVVLRKDGDLGALVRAVTALAS